MRGGRETGPRLSEVTQMSKLITRILLLLTVSVVLTGSIAISQRRRPTTRPPATAIDYTKFSHATTKHKGACNTCHKIPSRGWQKTSAFPDIKDYPSHDACVSCHRPQFFKGAKPPICAVCHSKTSPRDEVRFPFRNPASLLQFTAKFPHDKHQDVIARFEDTSPAVAFAHVRFRRAVDDQTYNNCTICHTRRTTAPKTPASGWIDGFAPQVATFKASPSNHASCFNCHWKSQQPVADNCAGCMNCLSRISRKLTQPGSQLGSCTMVAEKRRTTLPNVRLATSTSPSRHRCKVSNQMSR